MRALFYALITSIVWLLLGVMPYDVFAQRENPDDLISRYEFAEMLETTTCSTCLQPDETTKERYTEERFNQLKKDLRISLDDIGFEQASYKETDYYYCVASVVDRGIMRGFPRATSPYCTGKFCGGSIITFAELIASSYRLYCAGSTCDATSLDEQITMLIDLGIITAQDAEKYSLYEPVERGFIVSVLGGIEEFVGCDTIDDKDFDGIDDIRDDCPLQYDPRQSDYDNDGIGDICDDDIDNDGVKNELGVVDFQGILNRRLVDLSEDNCVIIPNTLQEECVGVENQINGGMTISGTPRTGIAPLTVLFDAQGIGLEDIQRFFGDGYRATGISVVHTYTDVGVMTVRAVGTYSNGETASAITQITVLPQGEEQIGYQIVADNQLETGPGGVTFFEEHTGTINRATWLSEKTFETTVPDQSITLSFDDYGLYFIESQAYNSFGEWVGLSQASLLIRKEGRPNKSSVLQASTLQPTINESVLFSTEIKGIENDEIERVERSFGDDKKETEALTTTFSFSTPGVYIVTQRIIFDDRDIKPHNNIVTIYVLEDDTPPAVSMTIEPLVASPGNPFVFGLDTVGFSASDVQSVEWNRSDGSVSQQTSLGLLDHAYSVGGDKIVTATVLLENNTVLFAQGVVTVTSENACLGEDLSVFACDLDNDGLPDLCDDDIDGDGIENRLGLLLGEPDECVYDDLTDILNEQLYADYQSGIVEGVPIDNCFLVVNTGQEDDNGNGVGNVCEGTLTPGSDDGSPSGGGGPSGPGGSGSGGGAGPGGSGSGDDGGGNGGGPESPCSGGSCSLPPRDDDGPNGGENDNPFVEVETCTQCPCPEADYGSSIWKGDRIRAIFLDESGEIIYRYTKPETIDSNIPDEMLGGG